jgi:hypothetical protein
MTIIDRDTLASVTGGFDEQQLRGWAAQNCPTTYKAIKGKTQAQITRADADRCVAEANPGFLMRGLINSQLDSYFGKK